MLGTVIGIIECDICRISYREITGTLVRLYAHVGSTLNIVLSAERIDAGAFPANIPGHHGDI